LDVPVETTAYDYSHYVADGPRRPVWATSLDSFQYFQPDPSSLLDAVSEDGDGNQDDRDLPDVPT